MSNKAPRRTLYDDHGILMLPHTNHGEWGSRAHNMGMSVHEYVINLSDKEEEEAEPEKSHAGMCKYGVDPSEIDESKTIRGDV
jgi:hypothetical protein